MIESIKINLGLMSFFVLTALYPAVCVGQVVQADLNATEQTIVVGQPLVLTLELTASTPTVVDLGPNRVGNLVFEIRDILGSKTKQRLSLPDFTVGGKITLKPGAPFRQNINLDSLLQPIVPGTYLIGLDIIAGTESDMKIASASPVSIQVKPYSSEKLATACHNLRRKIETASTAADRIELSSELADIQNPVAVADMRALLGHHLGTDDKFVRALWRIGNADAIDGLSDSLANDDPVVADISRRVLSDIVVNSRDEALRKRASDALKNSPSKKVP